MFVSNEILPSVRHDDHTGRVFNKSRWLAKFTGYFVWAHHLLLPKHYKIFMCCPKNLMMSVFCSNTLIFAPECWKCILRGPVFNFFPRSLRLQCSQISSLLHVFFLLHLFQSFCHLLNLIENPVQATKDCNFEA